MRRARYFSVCSGTTRPRWAGIFS